MIRFVVTNIKAYFMCYTTFIMKKQIRVFINMYIVILYYIIYIGIILLNKNKKVLTSINH